MRRRVCVGFLVTMDDCEEGPRGASQGSQGSQGSRWAAVAAGAGLMLVDALGLCYNGVVV